jgi:hypothetical protein
MEIAGLDKNVFRDKGRNDEDRDGRLEQWLKDRYQNTDQREVE